MKITQIKISPSILADKFIKYFKLSDYTDIDAPTLFMGCYVPLDYETIIRHRGFGVIRWCGTDAMRFNLYAGYINAVKEKPNIKHIAISDYIARDLDNIGIQYFRFPHNGTTGERLSSIIHQRCLLERESESRKTRRRY